MTNPFYIVRGGELVYEQPLSLDGTTVQGFILDADHAKLQAVVDKYLNAPANGAASWVALGDKVILAYTSTARAAPANPPDSNLGWLPEIDVLFWVPTLSTAGGSPHVAFFIPYSFVDTANAMAMGREIYGFPKTVGRFSFSGALPQPGPLVVEAVSIPTFGPQSKGGWNEVFRVERTSAGPEKAFGTLGELAGELLKELGLQTPDVTIAFLKQLRDVADPRRASYQAVIEAPATTTAFRSGGLSLASHSLTIQKLDSHPIADELGLKIGPQPARFPFWIDFDFRMGLGKEIARTTPAPPQKKQKIAVLGGGMGSLATVWALSELPDFANRFDVTVYQQGWRLGGKGASGRNAADGQRIEEHGLHVWLGFYENAFGVMRRCYDALGRPPGAPLATWRDAFKPHNAVGLMEHVGNAWKPWVIDFPPHPGEPGGGGARMLTPPEYMAGGIRFVRERFKAFIAESDWALDLEKPHDDLPKPLEFIRHELHAAGGARAMAELLLDKAEEALQKFIAGVEGHTLTDAVAFMLRTFLNWFRKIAQADLDAHDGLRRLYILVDLTITILVGMIVDEIPFKGYDVINDLDFIDWLAKHGASPVTRDSGIVRGLYQLVFGFPKGDSSKPGRFEAGTGLRCLLRLSLDYRGAIFWKMQAGMGDVVFAPLYEVLKKRGVKFEFFSRVDALVPSTDGRSVAKVKLTRQATVKDGKPYEPLVDVRGLPSWPSRPDAAQVVEDLTGVDLEDPWCDWKGVGSFELTDFDQIVLGIPLAALRDVCPDLIAARQSWRDMMANVLTVQTLAMQLWLDRDLEGLGWTRGSVILDGYAEPFDTWADMTHLAPREDWPNPPGSIAYFCGAFADAAQIPPYSDHGFPARELARVESLAASWLDVYTGALWPKAVVAGTQKLDPARVLSRYLRANVSPSERYVLSVPGSTRYRLAPGGSGFDNLVLAGDWTKSGLNAGCIEGATMSGLAAAAAVSGEPIRIVDDGWLEEVASPLRRVAT